MKILIYLQCGNFNSSYLFASFSSDPVDIIISILAMALSSISDEYTSVVSEGGIMEHLKWNTNKIILVEYNVNTFDVYIITKVYVIDNLE